MNKYNAKRTQLDGIWFDSDGEAKRYAVLKLRERAGEITRIECQPVYKILVNDKLICKYKADFRYFEIGAQKQIVEDFKNPVTAKNSTYRLKKKLVEAIYHVKIVEVMA